MRELLDLPNEQLDKIAFLIVMSSKQDGSRLCLVSHRFYDIAQPHLYRKLVLGLDSEGTPWQRTRLYLLHRTLTDKPSLGQHCHELRAHMNGHWTLQRAREYGRLPASLNAPAMEHHLVEAVFSSCSKVRSLKIYVERRNGIGHTFEYCAWDGPLLHYAWRKMPGLKRLTLVTVDDVWDFTSGEGRSDGLDTVL